MKLFFLVSETVIVLKIKHIGSWISTTLFI